MGKHSIRPSRLAAVIAAVSLAVPPSAPIIAAAAGQTTTKPPASAPQTQKPATPATTTQKPAATSTGTAATQVVDGGWPRLYELKSGGNFLVYQPQIASWENQKKLVAHSAVSYKAKASDKPAIGTIKLEATTKASLTERLVSMQDFKILEANFQTLPKDQLRAVVAEIEAAIPHDERVIALDRVLAGMDKSSILPKNIEGVKADPPAIFFSKTPAVIVNLDGEPIWSPIKDNDLKFAVNTNWDLFQHPTAGYFLRNEASWLKATDVKGPWAPAGPLPDSFKKLPAEENWKDVKANLPGKSLKPGALTVFVTQTPGELILLTGEPVYKPVEGTGLLWVSNTESDVFRMGKTGLVYYLVAGRWFSAADFTGPWTFATPKLPEDFKKISLEHERSRVLASVPGTDEAIEAVLAAQIPQTARVNKKDIKAPDVAFQGTPEMKPIEQTSPVVERVVNTDKDIFKVGDRYYMCYQGVWFVGKAANGPWEVAETVPQAIYTIPVSSPSHHVTYVTVEEDDDDDWVVFAAAAGYTGMMIAWGCMVWGSGWYYPPYIGYGGFYPYYYPHFPTYGYSAWYNPRTGAYGRSAGVYGPYGGAGVGARYNPRTGTYSRGAAAYGPYGSRGVASAYNPRTGTYAQTRQGSNVYGSWGSTSVQRGDDWAQTNRYTNNRTGNTTRTIKTDDGGAVTRRGDNGGFVGAGDGGNIYAGNDGNAYRRQDGTWQKYENGGWSNTDKQPSGERPTPSGDRAGATQRSGTGATAGTASTTGRTSSVDRSTTDQLNRDARARTEGSTRTRDYSNYKGGSGTTSSRSTGSYRSSGGGGARAGGGRRGR